MRSYASWKPQTAEGGHPTKGAKGAKKSKSAHSLIVGLGVSALTDGAVAPAAPHRGAPACTTR